MFVIEFLRSLNAKEVIEDLFKIPYFYEEVDWDNRLSPEEKEDVKKKLKERYIKEYETIIKKDDKDILFDEEKLLIVSNRLGDDSSCNDCYLLDLKEDKEKILEAIRIDSIENVLEFKNPLYSISFTNRNEVLGYRVSTKNIEILGDTKVAREIIREITMLALEEDKKTEKIEEIVESLKKAEEEASNKKYYTVEEVDEMLGIKDERTNVEKLRDKYSFYLEFGKSILNLICDIQEILIFEEIISEDFNKED